MKSDEVMERESNAGNPDAPSANPKFMIAGEAPILLGKACEMLVKELTIRAWKHTERNRRRTLQKQDVHAAVGESEVYDFLIDIVPRVASIQAAKGFTIPVQVPQADPSPPIHRATAAIVNEIPTINHAPPASATQQAAMSQAQLQMQYNFIFNPQQQGLVQGSTSATSLHQISAQQQAQHPTLQQEQHIIEQQLQNQHQTQQAQVAQAHAQAQARAQAQAQVQAMEPQQQNYLHHVQQYQSQTIPLSQEHPSDQQQYLDLGQNRNLTGE